MNIQERVRNHRQQWIEAGEYVMPDVPDALMFTICEVAEAMDAYLRTKTYVRNNPGEADIHAVGIELFDAVMMACNVLDILGLDLEELAREKLSLMDRKRGF